MKCCFIDLKLFVPSSQIIKKRGERLKMSEPEVKRPRIDTKAYSSESMYKKCHDALINRKDVKFNFKEDDEVIQISANKAVLAASSPVFDAEFNGELREKGDIDIVDASSEVFSEFLQFFYGHQVKLTMDNIAEMLKLIDKYDVADAIPICVNFLKDHLEINDILWGLHLAIKFRLDGLKNYCEHQILKNHQTVFDQINVDKNNAAKLNASSNHRLTERELEETLPCILAISKNIISTLSKRLYLSIKLSSGEYVESGYLMNNEAVAFSSNESMLLTDIRFLNVYTPTYEGGFITSYAVFSRNFDMFIEEKRNLSDWVPQNVNTTKIAIGTGVNSHKFANPILIKANYSYAIRFKPDKPENFYTFKTKIPDSAVELAPGVNITFAQQSGQSLISTLYFTHTIGN